MINAESWHAAIYKGNKHFVSFSNAANDAMSI